MTINWHIVVLMACTVVAESRATDVLELAGQLDSPSVLQRRQAAQLLADIDGPNLSPAIPVLVHGLEDRDDSVRLWCLEAIKNIQRCPPAALPTLIRLLDDDIGAISHAAQRILVRFGPDAVQLLAERLEQANTFGLFLAVKALEAIGADADYALPVLGKLLASPDTALQIHSAVAIAKINPLSQLPVATLLKGLELPQTEAGLRFAAAETLARFGREGKAAAPVLISFIEHSKDKYRPQRAILAMSFLGPLVKSPDWITLLEQRIQNRDGFERLLAAGALLIVEPKNKEARRNVLGSMPDLIRLLEGNSDDLIAFSARVLGSVGSEAKDALPALRKAQNRRHPLVQREAQRALQTIRE